MDRRTFLKWIASAGAVLPMISGVFVRFAEALDIRRFSFAHVCDLHLDVQGKSTWQHREKSVPLFIDTLRQIGRLPRFNFILFGGDQIHAGPNDEESLRVFQGWLSQINVPVRILLGNTEVSPVSGVSKLDRDAYLRAWCGKGPAPKKASWAFDPVPGVRFIGLDVTVDGRPDGEADSSRLAWLEAELSGSRNRRLVIIATHQLLHPTTPLDLSPEWSLWMVRNHKEVRELISRFPNVKLVISGHHHASAVRTSGGVAYVSDPAVVTYPCAFRVYTVTREGIALKNIGLGERAIVARARELLIADPYARIYDPVEPHNIVSYSIGLTEQDREAVIPL